MTALPEGLRGPVEVALARDQEAIPGPGTMSGGAMYELRWDGFRGVIVRDDRGAWIWSRHGKNLSDRFPDVVTAATQQLEPGTVVDGELVIWNGSRLDFDLLQRRLVNPGRHAATRAAQHPASYMAFDVLAHDGEDLRRRRLSQRRVVLETIAAHWRPPLQVSPTTTDESVARAWFADYRAAGIEGLVVKAAGRPYSPDRREWVKVKSRERREVIVGAVTGPLTGPETVVAGLVVAGELRIVGKTVPLSRSQSVALAAVLSPAGPEHPWPDEVSSSRFGAARDKVKLTKVQPLVVAEVLADSALQAGVFRHPLRYVRHRADLAVDDLDDVLPGDAPR